MRDNIFRKKLNDMGETAKEDIEKSFGGELKSGDELVSKFKNMTNKARLKVMKKVGAGLLSLLILAGFTGCVNKKGEIVQGSDKTQVSLIDETELPGSDKKPNYETTGENKPSTPEHTTEPTTPEAPTTPSTPETPTKPSTPENPTTPSTPEQPTTPEKPTSPEQPTEPTTPETTTGEDVPPAPTEYKYPKYFIDRVTQSVIDNNILGNGSTLAQKQLIEKIKQTTPEILFVERLGATRLPGETNVDFVIYAQYKIDENTTQNVKFAYSANFNDWVILGVPKYYKTYSEWVDAVVKAMKNQSNIVSASMSELQNLEKLDATTSANLAKIIDPNFVDVELNYAVRYGYKDTDGLLRARYKLYGFGYDKDNNSYSFSTQIEAKVVGYVEVDEFLNYVKTEKFTRKELADVTTTVSARVDSVFTATNTQSASHTLPVTKEFEE